MVWGLRLAIGALLVLATIILVRAIDARRRMPELKSWHRLVPRDFRAAELPDTATLAEYLAREELVLKEVREEIVARLPEEEKTRYNRYWDGSPNCPEKFSTNWNRTYEIRPESPQGGVLLLHGLTDSPYSLRSLATRFSERGLYVLVLRLPGHGTVPAGLLTADWPDWMAAVRLGMRHVRGQIGEKPLTLVGYSNGGALAVKYSLDALAEPRLPKADKLVLLSPMIGLTPFAGMAPLLSALGGIPYFEKSKWLDVLPEYNPFKYNSFPVNAAIVSYRLTEVVRKGILAQKEAGNLSRFPPVMAFQSVVDATIDADALVHNLFANLDNGSVLVLFDINRSSVVRPLLRRSDEERLARLSQSARRYRLEAITNASPETTQVVAKIWSPEGEETTRRLGLEWPLQVYSLSHVAVPFPIDDPLYGLSPDPREDFGIRLGLIAPHGERGVLTVPPGDFLRLTCNPFYPYLEQRVLEWLGLSSTGETPAGS
ncbi:MAG TPA: alpha/beta hydrolase [Thermoanaerobaculia bacterium]